MNSTQPRPETARLQRISKAFWESAALMSAVELDVFTATVQRVCDALLPDGEFHLVGEMVNAARTGPLAPALWGLSEAVNRSTGLAHTTRLTRNSS